MIQAPKGTMDIFGAEGYAWQQVENVIRRLCRDFCIEEMRTPTFEYTELFHRGIGDTTDVVQKEMYTFQDRGGRSFSLRPEGTAGVARAFIQNSLYAQAQPTKLYYITNCFRAERPQKGRMVEFHQFGVEFMGSYNAASDAEVISLAYELFRRLNVKNIELRLNSIGNEESRGYYDQVLRAYIDQNLDALCPTCRDRAQRNPMRVLDCKSPDCQAVMAQAPSILDCLTEECRQHFADVQANLTAMGIPYVVDDRIVRGLDYYTRTVFEFVSTDLGSQSTVCGGGRYDKLIGQCGGPEMGACGFGLGLERLMIILEEQGNKPQYKPVQDIFIGSIGEAGFKKAQTLVYDLRKRGIAAECDTLGRSVKAQMKYADKTGAKYAFVIGDDELATHTARLKDMATGEQITVPFSALAEFIAI